MKTGAVALPTASMQCRLFSQVNTSWSALSLTKNWNGLCSTSLRPLRPSQPRFAEPRPLRGLSVPLVLKPSALVQRVLTEARAGRHFVDAIETTLPGLLSFRDNQLLQSYTSPYLASFPDDGKERAPKNLVYWTIARESFIGFAYN